jgi:hypothetical protein
MKVRQKGKTGSKNQRQGVIIKRKRAGEKIENPIHLLAQRATAYKNNSRVRW